MAYPLRERAVVAAGDPAARRECADERGRVKKDQLVLKPRWEEAQARPPANPDRRARRLACTLGQEVDSGIPETAFARSGSLRATGVLVVKRGEIIRRCFDLTQEYAFDSGCVG
jgi:hypothetical protein